MTRKLTLLIALIFSLNAYSQLPALRGMYIDGFDDILGNTVLEDSLLHYCQDSSFNYIALYSLHSIDFTNSSEMAALASFIGRAREDFGIQHVGAVRETFASFDKIKNYNNNHPDPNEKFNVFNLEFEFWISSSVEPGGYYCETYLQQANCSCDTAGAFEFYISQLHRIDSLAMTQGAISETYVGWFNQGQGQQIQQNVDRILLHAYRVDPSSVYGYSQTRLSYLASNNQMVNVAPIFSSEPSFMGPWLNNGHSQIEAWNQYKNDFDNDNASWKPYINLLGYQWFDWGYMPKPVPGSAGSPSISASGPTSFCIGGLVTLTATVGDSYLWSNGETTRIINTSTEGTYYCDVTDNGGTQTTNSISVTVYDAPTVSVIVNYPVANTVPLSSTASAGEGTIASYQWKFNNGVIPGANISEYTATESGDYSLVVANSFGCDNSSPVAAVTVPITSCQLTTPTGTYSDNVTSSAVTFNWDPLPISDSIIVRYKIEASTEYIYVRFLNSGQTSLSVPGLLPNTYYSWRMKTTCGSSSSNYSTKKYFTTTPEITAVEHMSAENPVVNVYPNPASENINLSIDSRESLVAEVFLTDPTGKSVMQQKEIIRPGENKISMNVSHLADGIYFVKLQAGNASIVKRIAVK